MNRIRTAGPRTPFDGTAGKVCIAMLGLALSSATRAADHSIIKTSFGQVEGREIELYTLTNRHGIEARIMTYGAAIVSLSTPAREGPPGNIVLAFASLPPYLGGVRYLGA